MQIIDCNSLLLKVVKRTWPRARNYSETDLRDQSFRDLRKTNENERDFPSPESCSILENFSARYLRESSPTPSRKCLEIVAEPSERVDWCKASTYVLGRLYCQRGNRSSLYSGPASDHSSTFST